MAHVSLRVTDEEKIMENYANWLGVSLLMPIKLLLKDSDEYDLRVIAEYEADEKAGGLNINL